MMMFTETRTIQSPVGAEMMIAGRRYINFGGSSYLGLSHNPQILEAGCAALRECGSGYQFHRHYNVATRAHQEAEAEAAAFFGTPAALFMAGGYYFGLVTIAALKHKYTMIFRDEMAHHSLHDGAAASGLPSYAFRHLDAEDLEAKLKRHCRANEKPIVASDGMYSTFGDIAPLDELASVMTPYDARLLVDESHSFGVLGETGRGAGEHHGIPRSSIVIGGSTGKGLGVLGGIIPATEEEVAACRATPAGRGASSGLPAAASMCARSLSYLRHHPELLSRLRANVAYMKSGLRAIGLNVPDTVAPVAAFTTDSIVSMQSLQRRLLDEGIFVILSTYIGASPNGVIRCAIFADHTQCHMDTLLDALRRLL
jgi:8-amino-7-oxononanoate synthase